MTEDPAAAFRLLGLGASADAEAVRAAFRKLVSATHPDVVGDAGAEPTLALLAAYRTAIGLAESAIHATCNVRYGRTQRTRVAG